MREYRLIRIKKGDLFYPQVMETKCLFKIGYISVFPYDTEWKRISLLPNGFVLCNFDDYSYGKTWEQAKKIIEDYEEQFMLKDPPYVYSRDSQSSVRYDIEKRNNSKPKYKIPNLELNKQV